MAKKNLSRSLFRQWGVEAITKEVAGLTKLADCLDNSFEDAVDSVLRCAGRVVVVGIGKSGHIGRKIASTFSSTGVPAMFVHPAEASHGDLGMIARQDLVIAISKSGESKELSDILLFCRRFGITIIAITERVDSTLATAANILLRLPEMPEACPLGLAPTTSTAMVLAMGDALAVACLRARDFTTFQFRDFHPGGKLGQKLLRVRDVMHRGDALPLVDINADLQAATLEMSRGRFGCVGIVDEEQRLVGIFTDGDLRRHFSAANIHKRIVEIMSPAPQKILPESLLEDAANLFSLKRIPCVFVCVDEKPIGIIHVHDLLERAIV
jgi:arabinose-5-phosphate isomerase